MVEQYRKFIEKLEKTKQQTFQKAIKAILDNNFDMYDVKLLVWEKWLRRLRIWKFRITFRTSPEWNKIIKIETRGDVYKSL